MDAEQDWKRSSTWSVGRLAQASGLSVRVLRHWEDKGLVRADRSTRGHRRYGPDQVTRLYRALALRRTGLSLSQIAALLDEQDPDPAVTLRGHVEDLGEDLRRRGELRDRLVADHGEDAGLAAWRDATTLVTWRASLAPTAAS